MPSIFPITNQKLLYDSNTNNVFVSSKSQGRLNDELYAIGDGNFNLEFPSPKVLNIVFNRYSCIFFLNIVMFPDFLGS